MKVAVLLEEMYEDLEAWYPYFRLREEGIDTVFVGPGDKKEYASKHGYAAPEEKSIDEVSAADFEGVVIPGGYSPDRMRRNKKMVQFVKDMASQGKMVSAICHAGWMLCSAGVLEGKKATCFYAIKDDVVNAGADYIDAEVVVDGNIITSRNPYDLPAFSREMIKFLKGS